MILNNRISSTKKIEELKKIEEYFFKDMKDLVIIDLNAKIYSNTREAKINPNF